MYSMMSEDAMNEVIQAINGVLQCWAEEDALERVLQYQMQLDDEYMLFLERNCAYYGFDYDE